MDAWTNIATSPSETLGDREPSDVLAYVCRSSSLDLVDLIRTGHLRSLEGVIERLYLFRANLVEEGSFDVAIDGCDCVFLTTSPILLGEVNDPQISLNFTLPSGNQPSPHHQPQGLVRAYWQTLETVRQSRRPLDPVRSNRQSLRLPPAALTELDQGICHTGLPSSSTVCILLDSADREVIRPHRNDPLSKSEKPIKITNSSMQRQLHG
ncbi:Tetraketide alpha-pyrone reductase 1 [Platanthera zijinensis]|uniref:Tetraketide alpha-pyrone reductase 1 n=1 Tax=Platanthera zijinensis TaxID=2320716 RepID=A0AAP0BV96_9ASPA